MLIKVDCIIQLQIRKKNGLIFSLLLIFAPEKGLGSPLF